MCVKKPIPNLENYLAGEDGLIYSKRTGKPVYQYKHRKHGRFHVQLYNAGKRTTLAVHVLVARAWHGLKPASGLEVSHLNGDATDNRPNNLLWETHKENIWRKEGGRLEYIRV